MSKKCVNCNKQGTKIMVEASNGKTTRRAVADNPMVLGKISKVKVASILAVFITLFGSNYLEMFNQEVAPFILKNFSK